MSKPERQRASGVACFIDGIIAKRIQTLGSSVDITREQIQELANNGVVEYIADSPTVSIQMDTNDVGSTDTMALLCDKMISYTSTPGAGARGGFATNKFFIKTASSNATYRSITEQDMLNGYCSILAALNEEGTTVKRTLYMNHCAVTGVSLSYDVNGNASENYTLAADNKTWFLNTAANVRCYKPVNDQIKWSTAGLWFINLHSCIPTNSSVFAIGINNNILRNRRLNSGGTTGNAFMTTGGVVGVGASENGAHFQCTSVALSTPWMSTVAGSTDRCWIIYKPAATANFTLWESSSLATDPGYELEASAGALGAIRRGQIKAYLYNTGVTGKSTYTTAGKALRLQTVSIDVALGEEQMFQLGTDGFYGISKNTPVPITVTVTANDSDLEYFAALSSKNYAAVGVNQISISDFNGNNALRLDIYKDKAQTILLKTITCNKMYVQNENFNVTAGDNATHEMTFTTDNITIVGGGANITGGWSSRGD